MRPASSAHLARSLAILVPALAGLVSLGSDPAPAHACGGCFSPPETVTSVESHRMVVSLSANRSVLWDQIRYTGAPEDFVWVLPVPSTMPVLAVADDLFFAELEAFTAPQVAPPFPPPADCPPLDCEICEGGYQDAGAGAAGDAGVDIYQEAVVGPYETVVIGSEDPQALIAWLVDHGYNVPDAARPVIRHYTEAGMKFVVLRLAPDEGVSAMQPIRVEYEGYMASFPLKMVTVGAYASLQLTLWVIGEQRYRPLNYPSATIDPDELVWDFAAGRSNYGDVLRDTIDRAGGRAWITQAAQPLDSYYFTSPEVDQARADNRYPFLTRLATDMLVDHLTTDLELGPSDEGWLDRLLQASRSVNPPPPAACPTDCPCGPADPDGEDDGDGWPVRHHFSCGGCGASGSGGGGLLALVLIALVARRRRR